MHRITSLLMIAALLSVSSLPMLPQVSVCHAAQVNAECDACHPQGVDQHVETTSDLHAHTMHGPGMEMQNSMEHNNHHDGHSDMMHRDLPEHENHNNGLHDHRNIEQPKEFNNPKKQLSATEQACRIECGCGCNRSVDGFPQLLAPHVTSIPEFRPGEQIVRIDPECFPALQSIEDPVPSPPPKHS